jgi:hypothetical protein
MADKKAPTEQAQNAPESDTQPISLATDPAAQLKTAEATAERVDLATANGHHPNITALFDVVQRGADDFIAVRRADSEIIGTGKTDEAARDAGYERLA